MVDEFSDSIARHNGTFASRPRLRVIVFAFCLLSAQLSVASETGLQVATFTVEITPPLGQPVGLGFIPVLETAEHPLQARGLILRHGDLTCVVCALDLMEVHNASYDFLRGVIGDAAGIPPSQVALQAVHQHTAPALCNGAQSSELDRDDPRRVASRDYLLHLAEKLSHAVQEARENWQPITHLGWGKSIIENVASNRRLLQPDGSIHSRSSSTRRAPDLREQPEGSIDPWARTVAFFHEDRPVAHLHYYASHPQSFYGDGRASYDVPGIVRTRLEQETGAFQIYFTGCGGDIAFGKYNDGSRKARSEIVERLYTGLRRSLTELDREPATKLKWNTLPIRFPIRTDWEFTLENCRKILADPEAATSRRRKAAIALDWITRVQSKPNNLVELNCLTLGKLKLVHLPGEPFVQYQLAAQRLAPDHFVCVAGYGDCGMGYIGGDQIYTDRGGYEQTYAFAGPCESLFLAGIRDVLHGGSQVQFQGKKTTWKGFTRYDFPLDGRPCIVVEPKIPVAGRPWIWRARFFGHEPQTDLALLKRGFHLAYCDVAGLFGNPQAVRHWNEFYRQMTTTHELSATPALEGMSRGGLIVFNWAAANPEKVSCIYADAPVCDFKSWPGGKGKGKGARSAWEQCLKAYGLTQHEAASYAGNPIDQLTPLAEAGVPLLHVVGDADVVVPVEENTAILENRYKKLGGSIQVIHKPGVGHHPHSLKDPTPIVEFILEHTGAAAGNARQQ